MEKETLKFNQANYPLAYGIFTYVLQLLRSTQYCFSVRVFPEQDPTAVFVGWIKSDFHWNNDTFTQEHISSSVITLGDDKGKVRER